MKSHIIFPLQVSLTIILVLLNSQIASPFTIIMSDSSNLINDPHSTVPASAAAASKTDPAEQAAVYDIMRATGNEWATDIPDVCRGRWHGIECMPDGNNVFHVVSLSFGALSDDTAFPTCDLPSSTISPSITNLPHLRTLFFYRCLTANPQQIPGFLGKLGPSLQTLVLRENGHVGEIPYELGNLTGLTVLDLHGNYVNGSIPASLGRIRGLRSLDLSSNRLTGWIPGISFPDLRVLNLNQNHLTGEIPGHLLSSAGLVKIDLSRNRFTGGLPSLDGLEEVILLDLSYNTLTGPFPESFQRLKSVQALILSGNRMPSTSIPENAFTGLNNLMTLGLSDMNLQGGIPEALGGLPALRVVHLNDNLLNGSIPGSLADLKGLTELRLEHNMLTGAVPFGRERIWRMGKKLRLGNNLGLCYEARSGLGDDLDTLASAGIRHCEMKPGDEVSIQHVSVLGHGDRERLGQESKGFSIGRRVGLSGKTFEFMGVLLSAFWLLL